MLTGTCTTCVARPPREVSLYFFLHVAAGVAHGPDHLVERDHVLAAAAQGQPCRVDRLDRGHGVALDAGDLDQAPDGVAGEAEVVLHGDLGRVFHLRRRAAEHLGEPGRGHRARRAHLALAADLGAADRRVDLEQQADGAGGQQEPDHAVVVRAGTEARVVVQYGGDDARRPVGRGGHDPAPRRVLLVHGQGVQVHPVHDGQRVAQGRLRLARQLPVEPCSAARHAESRQLAFRFASAPDALPHRVPDRQQARAHVGLRPPRAFVPQHRPADGQILASARRQQLLAGGEGQGNRGVALHRHRPSRLVGACHEASPEGVVDALVENGAVGRVRDEAHAVRMSRQLSAPLEDEVREGIERNGVTAEQVQPVLLDDGGDPHRQGVHVDTLGSFPLQPEHQGPMGAMAAAGRRQGAVQVDADAVDAADVSRRLQRLHESPRRPHRTDRVGARRTDADGEEVEDADGHAIARSFRLNGTGFGRNCRRQTWQVVRSAT